MTYLHTYVVALVTFTGILNNKLAGHLFCGWISFDIGSDSKAVKFFCILQHKKSAVNEIVDKEEYQTIELRFDVIALVLIHLFDLKLLRCIPLPVGF